MKGKRINTSDNRQIRNNKLIKDGNNCNFFQWRANNRISGETSTYRESPPGNARDEALVTFILKNYPKLREQEIT